MGWAVDVADVLRSGTDRLIGGRLWWGNLTPLPACSAQRRSSTVSGSNLELLGPPA